MRKLLFIELFVLILVLVSLSPRVIAMPDDIHVPYDYPTIQAAINAANAGDTIIVHSGTYYEHIVVDKELVLTGEDQTAIIDGEGSGTVVNITSSGVMVRGFRIQNAGNNWTQRDSGIILRNKQFCYIASNYIENCRLGIYLWSSSQIEIINNTAANNVEGARLDGSSANNISFNSIVGNDYNLVLSNSDFNVVKGNHIADGTYSGIHLQVASSNNTVYGNMIRNCSSGVSLSQSDYNTFHHNSLIENTDQVWLGSSSGNVWNVDWPDGGNYWSDHNNVDVKSGQYQTGPGSDGICDSPYTVDVSNMDLYPCAGPVNYFEVEFVVPEDIVVISNSTISGFQMNTTEKTIVFLATGDPGSAFSRVDIPSSITSALWMGNYKVLVNGIPIDFGNWSAGSMTYIYFNYEHSTEEIVIIPESSSPVLLSASMLATLLTLMLFKRKKWKTRII